MAPLFSVRSRLRRTTARVSRAVRDAELDRLDSERALVLAQLARADGPLRLDGTSEALQRAVTVAVEHGLIAPTRAGYVPSSPAAPAPLPRPTPTLEDDVAAVTRYLENHGRASKIELMRELGLTNARMNAAAAAGRVAGRFWAARGPGGGYRLGAAPERQTAA